MNAKEELQVFLRDKAPIKCAIIHNEDDELKIKLLLNYNNEDLISFYKSLDFDYDNSYGCQYLEGTIWLRDGTWISRGEYDGSEWWEHNVLPEIPNDLVS